MYAIGWFIILYLSIVTQKLITAIYIYIYIYIIYIYIESEDLHQSIFVQRTRYIFGNLCTVLILIRDIAIIETSFPY